MTSLLLKLFVKDYKNTKNEQVRHRYGSLGGTVGIVLNIFLFIIKIVAGTLTGSISVTADAFNNLSDAGSSIITLVGFKMANMPNDKEHPFGHGRFEYIAGLGIAFIIILVGFELLKTSFDKILNPSNVAFSLVSLIILIISVLTKLWMGLFNKKLGTAIDSAALKATATDCLSDVCATLAVIIGLVVGGLTGFNPDGYIGILVAGFIMFAGIKAAKETLGPLLGAAPDVELVNGIRDTVLSYEDVSGIHDMIIHDYGPGRTIISLHAEVPSDGDIIKIHDTIDLIEMELREKFGCDATIHMDPLAKNDEFTNQLYNKVYELVRSVDGALSIHDFRVTSGPTHTNLIFDVVAPFKFKMTDDQLISTLKELIHNENPQYFAVIQVDKDYTASNW
ncbi:MAG: cation transporter [Clostridia bacterium]|nr:cation transporter [Clostridia bacterium]